MRKSLVGISFVMVVAVIWLRVGNEQRSTEESTENHQAPGVSETSSTKTGVPEFFPTASSGAKVRRIAEADEIRKKHEIEIRPLFVDARRSKRKFEREYRRYDHESEEYNKGVSMVEQARKTARDRERELWDELSAVLTPDELLEYKFEHSYYGKEIVEHTDWVDPPLTHDELLAVYNESQLRFDFMDKHLNGSEKKLVDLMTEWPFIYREGDPEYDLMREYRRIPSHNIDRLLNANRSWYIEHVSGLAEEDPSDF